LEALYAEGEAQIDVLSKIVAPEDIDSIRTFVRESLGGSLTTMTTPGTENLFSQGLDSLQTLQFVKRLNVGISAHSLSTVSTALTPKHIYTHPTIDSLSEEIHSLLNNGNVAQGSSNTGSERREEIMAKLVNKYTRSWCPPCEDGSSVIITGTTGSLGTYLLLALIKDPRIRQVYCFNRTSDARDRQRIAFENLRVDEVVENPKLTFVKVDLGLPNFGLDLVTFDDILRRVDIIIHNAWKVDFNHTVQSFEGPIAGVCGLVKFARLSVLRPRLTFISSVSSVGNWDSLAVRDSEIPESPMTDFSVAQRQGYGESKHIAEQILQIAVREYGIRSTILRVGQVAGPLQGGGCWNKAEWFPSLILTSKTLGLIPSDLPDINWIPVDTVADIIVDIIHSSSDQDLRVFNIVNPKVVPWGSLVPSIQDWFKPFKIQRVSLSSWITAVRSIDLDDSRMAQASPAVKILDFFEAIDQSCGRSPSYSTKGGLLCSDTMARLHAVSADWMRIWLKQWRF
jgi:thioester reductase-like protein